MHTHVHVPRTPSAQALNRNRRHTRADVRREFQRPKVTDQVRVLAGIRFLSLEIRNLRPFCVNERTLNKNIQSIFAIMCIDYRTHHRVASTVTAVLILFVSTELDVSTV